MLNTDSGFCPCQFLNNVRNPCEGAVRDEDEYNAFDLLVPGMARSTCTIVFRTSDFEEAGMQCLYLRWVLRSEFTNHETQQVSIWYLYII